MKGSREAPGGRDDERKRGSIGRRRRRISPSQRVSKSRATALDTNVGGEALASDSLVQMTVGRAAEAKSRRESEEGPVGGGRTEQISEKGKRHELSLLGLQSVALPLNGNNIRNWVTSRRPERGEGSDR